MIENKKTHAPVLITGDCKIMSSVVICLTLAHQPVVILTQHTSETIESLNTHVADLIGISGNLINMDNIIISQYIDDSIDYSLAIAVTSENLPDKQGIVRLLENVVSPQTVIAMNTESIALREIQKQAKFPERIIGVNWVEPAHTTYFLEVIANNINDQTLVSDFVQHAKQSWNKNPYIINSDYGIRSRLMCALIREAFYLVENGYVSFEDIDRACRNDAGYYLPFAGNFRYMDLMGTYIYGIVMKDMNPELTRQKHVPAFFEDMIQHGWLGMDNKHGFYKYADGEAEKWKVLARNFSYQIQEIIHRFQKVS